MPTTYLMPAARNVDSGQTIKRQDLSGQRYTPSDRQTVDTLSQLLAEDLSRRTRQTWAAAPITYTGN